MIKFFRKIRYKLLGEGKTGKYLKYAIGEILLVVVGILIALQINNWNEQQNLKRYEMIMLNEIRSSLQEDYARCRDVLSLLSRQVIANDSIIKSIKTELKNAKTIEGYFQLSATTPQIEFHISAYESLKSKGLDIISNDSLRIELSDLYDFKFSIILKDFSNYHIHLRSEWRPFLINNFQYIDEEDYNQLTLHPMDWDKLSSGSKMQNILIVNRLNLTELTYSIKETMNEIENMIKHIENYTNR